MRRLRSDKGPDICERTFKFGVEIVRVVRRLPNDVAGNAIGRQVIRSGTAVGAILEEADAAESVKDFLHKVDLALKEAQETRFWLRTIIESDMLTDEKVKAMRQESEELIRILNTIIANTKRKMNE